MGIRDILFGEETASLLIPSEFDVKLERTLNNKAKLEFDARVRGYFVAKGGKPEFVPEVVHICGMPEMNIRDVVPQDLPTVKRYALSVEYPKALAKLMLGGPRPEREEPAQGNGF
jgi:hypothetical protein